MKQYHDWIDNLKGIGIILIVVGHSCFPMDSILILYIFSFHVPMFFLLSGFLFTQKSNVSLTDFLLTRFNRLIVPYFSFNIIAYLVFGLVSNQKNYFTFSEFGTFFKNLLLGNYIGHGSVDNIMNIPTWFLPCLFFTGLYYFILDKYFKNKYLKLIIIIVLSVLIFFESKITHIRLPWNMEIAFMALLFYGIGNIFKTEIAGFVERIQIKYLLLIPILFFINIFFMNMTSFASNTYDNYFKLLICVASGTLTILIISKLAGKTFLGFFGANSIIVLCMEWIKGMTYSLFIILSFHYLTKEPSYLSGTVQTISTLIFIVPTIYIVNRYLPFLIGVYKRNKKKDIHDNLLITRDDDGLNQLKNI